ncbi:MAG: efflux RND transporter permease subunit [Nigerium sp.]|nr:efflux RND transporter permease subunit [Nigerium sp.]
MTKLSLAHRTVVMLLTVLTIALGVYAAGALRQEMIPSIDLPRGAVVTVQMGASPDVVEAQVSRPIETAVKGVDGVTSVTSRSSSGVSQVSVTWEFGVPADDMANRLRTAVDGVSGSLPSGVDPTVITGGTDDIPVVMLALSSDEGLAALSAKATEIVVPALQSVPGVREASIAGREEREIVIAYDPAKLDAEGIDPATIGQFFAAGATAIPSGTLRTDTANLDVQTGRTFSSTNEVANLRLLGSDGPVRLGDVATVSEQPVATTSISRVAGAAAVTVSITKQADANTVAVSHAIAEQTAALEKELGHGASFITVFDQAPFIEQSIHDLTVEGGIGLAMAVLVILMFLRSIRPTLITAISIPLSLLIAVIGLWVGGHTLNILTLGALTVAIGRVVDDSIVVIENIKRHQGLGQTGRDAIVGAVREVSGAITSSTLTTVAVFAPIGLVGGQAGEVFRPFAVAAVVALAASLLVSLTVVPVLASVFMRPRQVAAAKAEDIADVSDTAPSGTDTPLDAHGEDADGWLHRAYLPVLNWALAHRWLTVLIAVAVFAGTMVLVPRMKTDFIGSMGTESLSISQELPLGTGLAGTDAAATRVEEVLAADPDVQTYTTTIGGSSSLFMGGQSDTNEASFTVPLAPGAEAAEVAKRLREDLGDLGPDAGTIDVSVGASSGQEGLVVYVESSDAERLAEASEAVVAMLRGIDGLSNVTSDLAVSRDMLAIDVDPQSAADLGMTQASIGQAVARALRGQQIGTLAQGDSTLPVLLRTRTPVASLDELKALRLPVTQLMNAHAKQDAADAVTARSERLQAQSKAQALDAYNDQVRALRDGRAQALRAASDLDEQAEAATHQLLELQQQLELVQQNPNPLDPAVTASVYALTQQIAGVSAQATQLSAAAASSRAGVQSIDRQLDGLSESRASQLEAQAKQQEVTDAGKDAAKATAAAVRLDAVADVSVVQAPGVVTRVDGIRAATVTASSEGNDLGATTSAIEAGLAALELPDGVTVRIGGVSQQQADSFRDLGLAMAIAVFVVYLIMVGTFGSLLQPLILLVSVPFAATGALGLSLLTDTPLGVPSMIGLLMLIGIVVTNAIVLIDLINQRRAAGAGVGESIQDGARLRLRPIVMTALATIFALVPMGLGLTGGGVFISRPLAIVVIGGLVSSTLLTLILVPVLYDLLESARERRRRASGR